MRRYNPYRNIFYYYRGPSGKRRVVEGDRQIEDNTTKALINTLENSSKGLLKCFLEKVCIGVQSFEKVRYDLQIAEKESRADALIEVGGVRVFIESKVECPLQRAQLMRHLGRVANGYLLCITPRCEDARIADGTGDKRVRFITWKEIYLCFREYVNRAADEKGRFVIGEFVDYMEAINMAPFYGWHRSHFEAFLNVEDDPRNELRVRVKENLSQYLSELTEHLAEIPSLGDLEIKVGYLQKEPAHCWGVLCSRPVNSMVHKAHFNFVINADEFAIGVQVEGQKAARRFKRNAQREARKFLRVLRGLEGFDLTIRKRVQLGPRKLIGILVAQIALGKNVCEHDVEFIIKKMEQYRLCEIRCTKGFKRDDRKIRNSSFLGKSVRYMRRLEPYYGFCCG